MDRAQFHDKAWALWQEKALGNALLPKLSIHAIRTLWDVLYDSMPTSSQPAESKRVELTDDELGHLRLIVAFCETLSSIEIGSYAYDALCALRLFLARASTKGE
jgi:hypothetical protein